MLSIIPVLCYTFSKFNLWNLLPFKLTIAVPILAPMGPYGVPISLKVGSFNLTSPSFQKRGVCGCWEIHSKIGTNIFQNIVKSCFDFVWWVGCQVVAPVCGCCKIHHKVRTNTFLKKNIHKYISKDKYFLFLFWICAVVGLSGSSSSMWLLGHNKVFAPSQGGPSPPSSVTSLDNSPHFKPGSTPGQLCSSRKQLLGHIWSLLSNICSCLMHFWFKTKTLCWCPGNRGNIQNKEPLKSPPLSIRLLWQLQNCRERDLFKIQYWLMYILSRRSSPREWLIWNRLKKIDTN